MSQRLAAVAVALFLPSVSLGASVLVFSGVETPVSTAVSDQFDPAISGDLVVFTDYRNGNSDIYYVNLATGVESPAVQAPGDQYLTDVSNGLIVYTDYTNLQVHLFDTVSGATQVLSGSSTLAVDPAISQRLVVWTDERDGDPEIYARNLDTNEERRVSNSPLLDLHGAVSGKWIVWDRCTTAGDCDVWAYDWTTATTRQLTNTPGDVEQNPDVSGDTVVYQASRGGETDVYSYDLLSGVETRLSRPGYQINANVSGDFVAFDDGEGGTYHIKVWHLPTNSVFDVTSGASQQYLNDIDGNRIVYTDTRSGNADIYLFTFKLELPPSQCRSVALEASREYSPTRWHDGFEVLAPAMSFAVPTVLPVTSGKAGSHWATLAFGQGWATTFCFYQGQPTSYALKACTGHVTAGATVTADRVWLHVDSGDRQAGTTTVKLTLAEAEPCAGLGLPTRCDDVAGATPLVDETFVRTASRPNHFWVPFLANRGEGLVCVDNGPADHANVTSGTLLLNRQTLVKPSQWASRLDLPVTLRPTNLLSLYLNGAPGSAVRVRVYGSAAQTTGGVVVRHAFQPEDDGAGDEAMGCSQGRGNGAPAFLMGLLLVLAFLPRPARVLARSRR